MKSKEIKLQLTSCLPRLALLLYAIAPVTENKEWVFYTLSPLIIVSFLFSFIWAIQIWRKSSNDFIEYIIGSKRDNLYDLIIAFVGIIVNYSLDVPNGLYFWCFVLVFAIIELVYPFKLNKEKYQS